MSFFFLSLLLSFFPGYSVAIDDRRLVLDSNIPIATNQWTYITAIFDSNPGQNGIPPQDALLNPQRPRSVAESSVNAAHIINMNGERWWRSPFHRACITILVVVLDPFSSWGERGEEEEEDKTHSLDITTAPPPLSACMFQSGGSVAICRQGLSIHPSIDRMDADRIEERLCLLFCFNFKCNCTSRIQNLR